WHNATLTATTTTTTVNGGTGAVTVNHATGVTLAAHVASASGTPTGDVSFNTVPGLPNIHNGGIGSLTLDGLGHSPLPPTAPKTIIPGGTYTIKAHYGGDTSFAQSDDGTGVQVTVAQENSKVLANIVTFDLNTGNVVTVGATTFAFGSPYILRVDIENSAGTTSNCNPV